MTAVTSSTNDPSVHLDRLSDALGGAPPLSLAALATDDIDALTAMVQTARDAQGQALLDAVDHALRIVPQPLRGVVKKVIMR